MEFPLFFLYARHLISSKVLSSENNKLPMQKYKSYMEKERNSVIPTEVATHVRDQL